MRRRKFLVFLFFMLKRRRLRWERTTKEVWKRKVWVKKIFEERLAKGTFNLMVQQLRLEDRKNHFPVSTEMSLILFIAKLPRNIISYSGTIVDLKLH